MVTSYSKLLATFSDISNVFIRGNYIYVNLFTANMHTRGTECYKYYGYHATNVNQHCGWATSLLLRDLIAYEVIFFLL